MGRPSCGLPVPEGAYKQAREGLFTRAWSDRTRANGFKLKEGRFRLDSRRTFFAVRGERPWHRLPREAMTAPCLEVLKARLDGGSEQPSLVEGDSRDRGQHRLGGRWQRH